MHVNVVSSSKSLHELRETLEGKLSGDFAMRVVCSYNRDRTIFETNRTLLFTREPLPDDLTEETGLDIESYDWARFKGWTAGEEERSLHFKGFRKGKTPREIKEEIKNSLSFLLRDSDYEIDVPISRRSVGDARGFGTLSFKDKVPDEDRKLAKLLCHNMHADGRYISFHWCKVPSALGQRNRRVVDMERHFYSSSPMVMKMH